MKKYLFWLWVGATGLTACGDDDDPVVPELNKLTRVSCYKGGASTPLFTADINYTSDGRISNIDLGADRLLFIYSDGKFSITGVNTGETIEEYTLSGSVITGKRISQENPYASNEVYVSDEYVYRYSGSDWAQTSWVARWPKASGGGYEERSYPEYERYTWENGNVVLYAQSQDSREMRYEYGATEAPGNFPLRVIGSFSPTGFEAVTPLNLLYGARNRNLPVRAYTYAVPDPGEVKAAYTYAYTTVGDYITGMTITESDEGGESSYRYAFEYNFEVR